MSVSFVRDGEDKWKPDVQMLKLYCGADHVGTCEFDIATYIGKNPKKEKALVKSENYQPSDADERFLRGNAAQYPGAFLEFKITVQTREIAKAKQAAAVAKKQKTPKKLSNTVFTSRAPALYAKADDPHSSDRISHNLLDNRKTQ